MDSGEFCIRVSRLGRMLGRWEYYKGFSRRGNFSDSSFQTCIFMPCSISHSRNAKNRFRTADAVPIGIEPANNRGLTRDRRTESRTFNFAVHGSVTFFSSPQISEAAYRYFVRIASSVPRDGAIFSARK